MDELPDLPVPRKLKAVTTDSLLELEQCAWDLGLSRRLDPEWVREHAEPGGRHYLRPAFWHYLFHRSDVPRQLRCELLIALRSGERVLSLLDVLPETFPSLPTVTSREEGMPVLELLRSAPGVQQWMDSRDGESA
ncbi:hypothetical protein [Streptomyces sp. NPDC003688]